MIKTEPLPEFVTVAQAIPILGVSERSVRRYGEGLPDTDRQVPDKGPKRYRLSALRKAAGEDTGAGHGGTSSASVPDTKQAGATAAPDSAGQGETVSAQMPPVDDGLLEHLRGEVEYLRQALSESHANERAALAELAATRQQNAVLIAATATGRISGYGASDSSHTGDTRVSPLTTQTPGANRDEQPATGSGTTDAQVAEVPDLVPIQAEAKNQQETGKEETPEAKYSLENNQSPARRWFEFWKR